jgi:cell pole-organizing protein PopZ
MGDINRDPSMEEILASIKRVIADDGRASARPTRAETQDQPVEASMEEDVLELSDPVSEADGLTSDDTTAATRKKLAALAAMRQPENGDAAAPSEAASADTALANAVRDMLRPMLKDWLDQRLPEMVETMVAREIARITGKSL